MAERLARVSLSPQAEAYLLEKRGDLSGRQQYQIERLLLEIQANPYLGEQHRRDRQTTVPMGTFFYVERHIGERMHMRFHYDLVLHQGGSIAVEIKAVWVGYKL